MNLKRIAITGAAGQIAYSLLFRLASGDLLGPHQPIALHLLDLPPFEEALKGVRMELEDSVFPLLKEIKIGSQPEALFEGVHYAFLIGAKPRGPGMERKDLLADNGKIFVEQGKALNRSASPDVRVLVVGNPCNTNCLIAMHHAPDLPRNHFHAMTRLDQNRGLFQLAKKANVDLREVTHLAIWGNHSATQVPDFHNAKIHGAPADKKLDRKWLETEFISTIQQRGAAVIAARGKSSAASAAQAALGAMKALLEPTPHGEWFSSAVYSKSNPYGIDENLVFSFPCRSKGRGDFEIVQGLAIDAFLKEKLALTEKELIEERDLVRGLLK
ncbi:MAG: malate dehydrogenase [Verrucomicrobia bacterium]|nr:malate dehydrogenase [Verrucomicrobiota bacterium]MDE3047866.1 malate dehydrogenase [Verrucomicrobiota bacterium]